MPDTATELARRLARDSEAVCRRYLSNGRRQGRYWLVGDVHNTPGRSLFVRLGGPDAGKGAAGRWTDAATGEHGDLLDLIATNQGLTTLGAALSEVRRFLALPRPERRDALQSPAPAGSPEAARRLWAMSRPLRGTVAEAYLRKRGIATLRDCASLRLHPRCFYRPDRDDKPSVRDAWPALIAAVTDLDGTLTGVHRTWLDPSGGSKAPIATPRRAMGGLRGRGVRFGQADDVMAAGEGVETVLSLRTVLPTLPAVAALSAGHLAALDLPPTLRRLYIAEEADPAGRNGADRLAARAEAAGVEAIRLTAVMSDLNADLAALGAADLLARLRVQLAPEDVTRFVQHGTTRSRMLWERSVSETGKRGCAPGGPDARERALAF